MAELIHVDEDEYNELCRRERVLCALESAGVDNWEGYGIAMDCLHEGEV